MRRSCEAVNRHDRHRHPVHRGPLGAIDQPAADGESSCWSTGYLPVARRARVGLLPSRSGRISMYAATNRPSPPTRSPGGARRSRAGGVIVPGLDLGLPARSRRSPSTSHPLRAPSSPCRSANRRPTEPGSGQPCGQDVSVIACRDERVERVRRSGRRPDVRPISAQGGTTTRLENLADGLAAPLTRVPEGKPPAHGRHG
jgi:hypothetical protein